MEVIRQSSSRPDSKLGPDDPATKLVPSYFQLCGNGFLLQHPSGGKEEDSLGQRALNGSQMEKRNEGTLSLFFFSPFGKRFIDLSWNIGGGLNGPQYNPLVLTHRPTQGERKL